MERMVQEKVAAGQASVVPELMQSIGGGRMTSSVIFEALKQKDVVMEEVLAIAQHTLGLLAGNLINILDPQMIVFGGGVTARLGDRFVGPIPRVAFANLGNKKKYRPIKIVGAERKDDTRVGGAAGLATEHWG